MARSPEAQTLLIVSEETSLGMPGLDLRLARRDLPLAGLQHLAHHDVLDLLRLDPGALERGLDRDAPELGGVERREAAAHLADRRACGAEDHSLGHGGEALLGRNEVRARDAENASDAERMVSCRYVDVSAHNEPGGSTGADTVAVGIFEGEETPPGCPARRRS